MRARSLQTGRSGTYKREGSAAPSLALWIFRVPHLTNRMRLVHQALKIVHESLAAVLGILVVTPDVNRFLRADLLAVSAEDAAEFVDLENERIAVPFFVLPRYELDAIGGTYRRAQATGDALRLARFRGQHTVRAAPARRDR